MKRIAAGFFALAVAAGLLIWAFQVPISYAIVGRALEARVGFDASAGLPDGLNVVICGSGSPVPDPARAGPCSMVIAGERVFVIDAGEGGARNLGRMGMPMGRLEGVFLTHFHPDHIDGLGPMILARWTSAAATTPLPVYGPAGVETVVAGFNAAYSLDRGYRTAHHGPRLAPPAGAVGLAKPFALPPAGRGAPVVVFDDGALKVIAFRVNHEPVDPAVGYRFDYKGRSVVFSGDTGPSPSLVAAARGADVLVHEALQPKLVEMMAKALDAKGLRDPAELMRAVPGYHSSPEQAADAARAAGVRQLVLNHIGPPLPLRFFYPMFLGEAREHFAGPIVISEDGMLFSLPANDAEIQRKKLL